MTLGQMRAHGVRSVDAECQACGHEGTLLVDLLPDHIPVPDVAVRLAGLDAGEYHFAHSAKQDQYDRLKGNPRIALGIVKTNAWIAAVLNHKQGVMAAKKLRQAMQAALDMEPIMSAAIGHKDFYRIDGALYFPEQALFHSQTGVSTSACGT